MRNHKISLISTRFDNGSKKQSTQSVLISWNLVVIIGHLTLVICLIGCGGSNELPHEDPAQATFFKYCSPCHGEKGTGDGYNAEKIDPKPRNLTDGDYMSSRTDEQLLEAISKGGVAVAKSVLMPPWGNTLKEEEIHNLVRYIRTLHPKVRLKKAPPKEEEKKEEKEPEKPPEEEIF